MSKISRAASRLTVVACAATVACACTLPTSLEDQLHKAGGAFRGTVLSNKVFTDNVGHVYTETVLQVEEAFKGQFPPLIRLVHRGGSLRDVGEFDSLAPQFQVGSQTVSFVHRGEGGRVEALLGQASVHPVDTKGSRGATSSTAKSVAGAAQGGEALLAMRKLAADGPLPGEDFGDQAADDGEGGSAPVRLNAVSVATNLISDNQGISARLLAPDRREYIPYYVDATYLPTGVTRDQAMQALSQAFGAWEQTSSLRFKFAGFQNFGVAAANVEADDGAIRVQLHDAYGLITGTGDVLGRGGLRWSASTLSVGWTMGGSVNGNDFHKSVGGWVVLEHENPYMANLANMTEVLCHEIGHALALSHSSNDYAEANEILRQSIMFFTAHGDSRGATLNSFDTNTILQVYPTLNTPPYTFDRFLDAITTFNTNTAGFNVLNLRGYDSQSASLKLELGDTSGSAGTFTVSGHTVSFAPNAPYDATRVDPASGSHYGILYYRYSDGTNASPYKSVRVVSLGIDRYNEGIPDSWRQTWFGSGNPAVGSNHHANEDCDGDGYSNLQEFRLGSNPVDKTSNLRLEIAPTGLRWQAKAYELYEIDSSTDLTSWTLAGTPVTPSSSEAVVNLDPSRPKRFYRVSRVP